MAKNERELIRWNPDTREILPADAEEGIEAWLYHPSNAVMDKATGKILKAPQRPDGSYSIASSEDGRRLAQRRIQLAREAREQALLEGTKSADSYDAIKVLTLAQVRLALDESQGRASTEAYKLLMAAQDYLKANEDKQVNAVQVNVNLSPDVFDRYVIDAEFEE